VAIEAARRRSPDGITRPQFLVAISLVLAAVWDARSRCAGIARVNKLVIILAATCIFLVAQYKIDT